MTLFQFPDTAPNPVALAQTGYPNRDPRPSANVRWWPVRQNLESEPTTTAHDVHQREDGA